VLKGKKNVKNNTKPPTKKSIRRFCCFFKACVIPVRALKKLLPSLTNQLFIVILSFFYNNSRVHCAPDTYSHSKDTFVNSFSSFKEYSLSLRAIPNCIARIFIS